MTFRLDISPLTFQKLGILPDPEKQKKEAAAALQKPYDVANMTPAVPTPEDVPNFDSENATASAKAAVLKRGLMTPQWREAALKIGESPQQLIEFYKTLDPTEQEVFNAGLAHARRKYWMDPNSLDEHQRNIIESAYGINKSPKAFDINAVKSPQEIKLAVQRGDLTEEEGTKLLSSFQPNQVTPPVSWDDARAMGPQAYDQQFGHGSFQQRYQQELQWMRDTTGAKAKETPDKPPFTQETALNEVQQKADKKKSDLEKNRYQIINMGKVEDKVKWEAMPQSEKDKYTKLAGNPDEPATYYRESPDYAPGMKLITDFEQNFQAQKDSADALQAIFSPGAPGSSASPGPADIEQRKAAAQEMGGDDTVNVNSPVFWEVYKIWKQEHGQNLR